MKKCDYLCVKSEDADITFATSVINFTYGVINFTYVQNYYSDVFSLKNILFSPE